MIICLYCGDPIEKVASSRPGAPGRRAKFCSTRCRVNHHRREKRYSDARSRCNEIPDLNGVLILELFPGAGLFGRAFESLGATVVRGPDILWGGDVCEFRGLKGRFDGVIGGPPCQFFSRAAVSGTSAVNRIPEFVRLVEECKPAWAVMENVREARPYAPDWDYVFLRDWDCGGHTHRRRGFWFYNLPAPPASARRAGTPEYSVLASNWNKKGSTKLHGHLYLSPEEAGRLQGYPELTDRIWNSQPGWQREDGRWDGVSKISRDVLTVHMLGNGVPAAMGKYIATYVAYMLSSQETKNGHFEAAARVP